MEQVDQSELIIGELYCDQPRINSVNATVMRYLGRNEVAHEFKYISGVNGYINRGDDIIRLAHYRKEPNWYWKIPDEETKIILKYAVKN